MRLDQSWLEDWVALPEDLVALMNKHALEVEPLNPERLTLEGVIIGEVLTATQHPNADKLKVTQVNVGKTEPLEIVCGCPTVKAGMRVPVATVGAQLPRVTIARSSLRGVASEGMLCSLSDLGLTDQYPGLYAMPSDAPVGESLVRYFGLSGQVLDFEITPNRGDCFSARGLAREIAALSGAKLQASEQVDCQRQVMDESLPEGMLARLRTTLVLKTELQTPVWLQLRLQSAGIALAHPVEDVLNYVMLDTGQPLLALADLSTMTWQKGLRQVSKLAGVDLELTDDDWCLSTPEGEIHSLAGVFQAPLQVPHELAIEAVVFEARGLQKSVQRLSLHTPAAVRMSRYVNPCAAEEALLRACALLVQLGVATWQPLLQVWPVQEPAEKVIELSMPWLERFLGLPCRVAEVADCLRRLSFEVDQTQEDCLHVRAPMFRNDIEGRHDLAEEFIRLYGFDRIARQNLKGRLCRDQDDAWSVIEQLRQRFMARGYQETLHFSFISESECRLFDDKADEWLALNNPLSQEAAYMRPHLLSSLLMNAKQSQAHGLSYRRVFECARVYRRQSEQQRVACMAYGQSAVAGSLPLSFQRFCEDVTALLPVSVARLCFQPLSAQGFHPGAAAAIVIDGQVIGVLGQLHPQLAFDHELRHTLYLAEWHRLDGGPEVPQVQAFSQAPYMLRDVNYCLPEGSDWTVAKQALLESAGNDLKEIQVFDIYQDRNLESVFLIGVRYVFQGDRGLSEEQVAGQLASMNQFLEDQFAIKLR